MGLSSLLISYKFTRDDFIWLWGRLSSGAVLLASGLIPLDQYIGPTWAKVVTVTAVIVLWLSGKYDSSPLPGKKL